MEEGTVRADNTLCLFIASGRQLPLPHKISISIFTDGLTDTIKEVLDTPEGEADIEPAALLLPKLNRILYESIPRRKNVDKLKYERRKIHTFRSREEPAVRCDGSFAESTVREMQYHPYYLFFHIRRIYPENMEIQTRNGHR
jgi:hypothetical protein